MIDIKELRIGSHLNYDGKRLKIVAIDNLFTTQPHISVVLDDKRYQGYEYPIIHHDNLQPIPITADLLTELGFEKIPDGYIKSIPVGGDIADWDAHVYVEYDRMEWQVNINDKWQFNHYLRCCYLHQLENFVYLTLHKELIDE